MFLCSGKFFLFRKGKNQSNGDRSSQNSVLSFVPALFCLGQEDPKLLYCFGSVALSCTLG
jgi:hypothetical protein